MAPEFFRCGNQDRMSLEIRRYRPTDALAIDQFNIRMAAGGVSHRLYPENEHELSGKTDDPRFTRLLVAARDGVIHGGVWLTSQSLRLAGTTIRASWIKYPVAESLIDPAHAGIPAAIVLHMTRAEGTLLSLGLGGRQTAFARILDGFKWSGSTVPFYFRIVRPARVLRHLRFVRSSRLRAAVMDVLAGTGLGAVGFGIFRGLQRLGRPTPRISCSVTEVDQFGSWTDRLWDMHCDRYSLVSMRDQATLNDLYPSRFPGLSRLRISDSGRDLGWACTTRMDLRKGAGHRVFGRLVVGCIADCFSSPEDATTVVGAATRALLASGVDLLVSNQSHPAWGRALQSWGFMKGPSNFAFYRPPAIQQVLDDHDNDCHIHITRGDGDGPRWA